MKRKLVKKAETISAAAIMTAAMCAAVPVRAAVPTDQVTGKITVSGIEDGATVLAYRIVKGTYNSAGLTGYAVEDGLSIQDITKPTSEEITDIVSVINDNKSKYSSYKMETTDEKGTYSASVPAGEYVVLVGGTNTNVYNPMIVSINYGDANDSSTIGKKGDSSLKIGKDSVFAYGNTAYAKVSAPTLDKYILQNSTKVNGATVSAAGENSTKEETISFGIDTTIPSYKTAETEDAQTGNKTAGSVYQDIVYEISDQLEDTFTKIENVKVKESGGAELKEGTDYIYTAGKSGTQFTIQFQRDYLLSHGGTSVSVTYNAALKDTETDNNYAENRNTAKLRYSNDPSDSESTKEISDHTYHYTFSIDGLLDGEDSSSAPTETHELNKVTDEEGNTVYEETDSVTYQDKSAKTQKSRHALAEAEFGLYTDASGQNKGASAVSDQNGHIHFSGLDQGTYYLKETKAPSGYTLNDTTYQIDIKAELDETGIMTKYSVKITNLTTGAETGTASYTNENASVDANGDVTNHIKTSITPAGIQNTRIAELPSTGGSGTLLFTAAGITLMAAGAAAYFGMRRTHKTEN